MAEDSYAGDLGPPEAWRILEEEPGAVLIDVRTDAEWAYVGLPDLRRLGKQTVCVAWQTFPGLERNPDFLAQLESAGVGREQIHDCQTYVFAKGAKHQVQFWFCFQFVGRDVIDGGEKRLVEDGKIGDGFGARFVNGPKPPGIKG